jgi:hypothetical protein
MLKNILVGIAVLIGLGMIFGGGDDTTASDDTYADRTVTQIEESDTSEEVVEDDAEPVAEEESAEKPKPKPKPEPQLTSGQENAIAKASDYLDYSAWAKSELIGQLEYSGFSTKDATFAVNYLKVNWREQAVAKAKDYLEYSAFSKQELIGQLEYNGFTRAEATYGVNKAY